MLVGSDTTLNRTGRKPNHVQQRLEYKQSDSFGSSTPDWHGCANQCHARSATAVLSSGASSPLEISSERCSCSMYGGGS